MSYIQIPNLPVAIGLTGGEQLEAVQAGVSVRLSTAILATLPTPQPISPGFVTQYQFFSAIPLLTPAGDPNLLFQALTPDFGNAATVQFYTSPYVGIGSPIYALCQSTYGYTSGQMATLMGLATLQALWG